MIRFLLHEDAGAREIAYLIFIGRSGDASRDPILEYSTSLNSTFTEDTAAAFGSGAMLIRTSNPNQQRFFRIRATRSMEITSLSREGSELVLRCRYR